MQAESGPAASEECRGEMMQPTCITRKVADKLLAVHYCKAKPCT
jgi:hypothetical protein